MHINHKLSNRFSTCIALLGLVVTALAATSVAASPFDTIGDPVTVTGYSAFNRVPQGSQGYVAVRLELHGHWHVNAHKTNDEFLIATEVEFTLPEGVTLDGIAYPEPVEKQLSFSDKPLLLYEGEAVIAAQLAVAPSVPVGEHKVIASVTYQACDNEKCVAPEKRDVEITLAVSDPTTAIDVQHQDVFKKVDFAALAAAAGGSGSDGATFGGTGATATAALTTGGRLGAVIANRGWFVAFLLVYLWGLALNLTPCVYPIIPITVGYFGGQAGGQTGRTFGLAATYVLGMAAMYSALGLVAALTGSLLGTALQNPLVIVAVAAVLIALSLSMFGLYEFRVPAALNNLAGKSQARAGAVGAFLMGLTVGIVAAPCIGPFVLALLTFVGESGNPVIGFSLFFTLAIGLGTPFLFLAVLSGNITRLPKSGEWMEWVKKLFGVILLAMAAYFLEPLFHDRAIAGISADVFYYLLMGAIFIVGGVFLGFVLRTQSNSLGFRVFKRFVGIAAPLLGLYLILAPGHIIARDAPAGGIAWTDYDDDLLASARASKKFVLIDFSADWCLPCKELDHLTFSQQEVVDATTGFVTLRADLTQAASPEVAHIRKQFDIRGVPTVVFIDPAAGERTDLRVFGFVDKDDFLERVNRLKGNS